MPILKRRPTLANWLLAAVFLGVVFYAYQHLFSILGNMLGLLIVSLYGLVFLLPFMIWAGIGLLVLVPFVLLVAGLLMLWRHLRKRAKSPAYYRHHPVR
jgi:hypothetical protein